MLAVFATVAATTTGLLIWGGLPMTESSAGPGMCSDTVDAVMELAESGGQSDLNAVWETDMQCRKK